MYAVLAEESLTWLFKHRVNNGWQRLSLAPTGLATGKNTSLLGMLD